MLIYDVSGFAGWPERNRAAIGCIALMGWRRWKSTIELPLVPFFLFLDGFWHTQRIEKDVFAYMHCIACFGALNLLMYQHFVFGERGFFFIYSLRLHASKIQNLHSERASGFYIFCRLA